MSSAGSTRPSNDAASNWETACAVLRLRRPKVVLSVWVLVTIGKKLGVTLAHDVYQSLAQEPVDETGRRVDWLEIQACILHG